MQTFLPHISYAESASVLDRARLGKQRSECKIILNTLLGKSNGWRNHPAVKMWRGHEYSLCKYSIAMCEHWIARGYDDSTLPFFEEAIRGLTPAGDPVWVGSAKFHSSHRSNLLRKLPEWYSKFNWKEPPDLPYYWPVN